MPTLFELALCKVAENLQLLREIARLRRLVAEKERELRYRRPDVLDAKLRAAVQRLAGLRTEGGA